MKGKITQQVVERLCREKLSEQRQRLLHALRRQDIWQREDIEPFIDEMEKQVWQAQLKQRSWLNLEENYSKSELGLRSVIEVDTNGDNGGDEVQINKAIQKLGSESGKISGKKRRKARELLETIASAGYYGYLVLRRKLGIPFEHPVLKPWYAKFLPLIPSLINPGGIILLKEGTFTVSSPVLLTKDYVKIEGAGPSTILTQPDGTNSHIIQIGDGSAPVSYCTISSLRVNGNKDGQTDTCYGIYAPAPPTGEYNYYDTIERCVVENCYDAGILFSARTWHFFILDNIVKNNGGNGIQTTGDYSLFSLNMIFNNKDGMFIQTDGSALVGNLVMDNNTRGIYISASGSALAANRIQGSSHNYALFIREPKTIAVGNRIYFSAYGGIYIDGAEECIICANHIAKGEQVAILLQAYTGHCERCIVADNTIYSPSQSANAGYPAIYLQHYGTKGVKNVLVAHNTIFADTANRPSYGVEESDSLCDYNRIINNYIEGMATGAIKTLGAHTLVRNNFGAINVKTVTADYAMTWADESILADASAAAITITLPDPASYDALVFIKKVDSSANAVTIAPHGTETIDGASSMTLANQNDAVRLRSDGTNWFSF